MGMVGMRTVTLVVAFVTLSCRRCTCAPPLMRLTPLAGGAEMTEPDTPFAEVIAARLTIHYGTEEIIAWRDNELLPAEDYRFVGSAEPDRYVAETLLDTNEEVVEIPDERLEDPNPVFVATCELNDDSCEHLYEQSLAASPVAPEPVPTVAEDDWLPDTAVGVQNEATSHARDREIQQRPATDRQERVDRVARMVLSKKIQNPEVEPAESTRVPEPEVQRKPERDRRVLQDSVVRMLLSQYNARPNPQDLVTDMTPPRAPDSEVRQKPDRGRRALLDSVVRMLLSQNNARPNPQDRDTDTPPRSPDSEVQPEPPAHKFRDAVYELMRRRAMQAESEKATADAVY